MITENDSATNLSFIRSEDIFYRKFTNNGSANLAVDGSVTPVIFSLENLEMDRFILTRLEYLISVNSSLDVEEFGDISELVNGVEVSIGKSVPFKNNADILLFGADNSIIATKISGTTVSIINGHWNANGAYQNGLHSIKDNIFVKIQDDLSNIKYFEMAVFGIKLGE